jgi:CDP-glycerol glycerophosphotransferase
VAAFTFGAGNAAGLRRIPLYLLGWLGTLLVPRTNAVWAFGSGIGPGEGALPLYRAARARFGPDVRLVWLASTERELHTARGLGLDAVGKLSPTGWWLTARARVLVVTHGQGDVNRYAARGAFLVQLWHGIPLKRLHLDSPAALLAPNRLARAVVARGYRVVGRQIRVFPVASERVVDRVCSAFGLRREQVLVCGDPRDDVLLQGTPAERRARAQNLLEQAVGPLGAGPVILYAPTWRDGAPDPAQPDAATWREIAGWLDRVDGTLLVRNHPLGAADYAAGPATSPRIRLLAPDRVNELNPLLPAVDHLVTDYSSVAFDFALTDGTIVFLAADVTSYLATRGLYEPYSQFTGGRQVATWQQALHRLDALVAGDPDETAHAEAHTRRLRAEHFDFLDGRATERLLDHVLCRVGVAVPGRRRLW